MPRSAHAEWAPPRKRIDPVAVLEASAAARVPELVPVRYGRMLESPFAFLRGSAEITARDLATTPTTGLRVQACGDAHIGNFGAFATPERNIVFDINDFDETLPGPWEWDVKRLLSSVEVVMRGVGVPRGRRQPILGAVCGAYRSRMAEYARLRTLEVWYTQIEIADAIGFLPKPYRRAMARDVAKAKNRTHFQAMSRLTEIVRGRRRFIEDPPVMVRLENTDHDIDEVHGLVEGYRASLTEDIKTLFDRFRLIDVARKAVGVGSVGTRCWLGLLEVPDNPAGDPLVLQVKEAQPSVLEPFVGPFGLGHDGLRVVTGQRLMQAVSDILLGWSDGPRSRRHYYVRQLWDVKGSSDVTAMDLPSLSHYGQLCAWALARAHARTGDAVAISGYLGTSDRFDRAVATFADTYAAQVEADHRTLVGAVRDGHVEAAV